MRRTVLVPAAAAIALLAATLAPAAQAADPTVVAEGLVSPLSLAVADDGSVFVSQNFAGVLTRVPFGGEPTQVFADEAQREVGAVSVSGTVVTFATTGDPMKPDARLWTRDGEGTQTLVANLGAYEKKNNADAEKTYGIGHLGKECTQAIPRSKRAGIVPYGGIVESHPYASYVDGATTYVADAAANAIWAVDGDGVRTVAVLPRVKASVTKSVREHFGLPRCTQGKTFHGEPVPTDVELGPDGLLYVTTLGGALGEAAPVGAIYQIDPATGETHRTTKGLMSPVGLAIAPNGAAYISLLFPGLIMRQPAGGAPEVFETAAFPGDVEYFGSTVYATLTDLTNEGDSPPAGQVVRWPGIDGCRGARC